ncbi:hypothetical protein AGMMS50289_04150 [Betaproteobacteria bacterium]|nr:hypothetical protein AGMMS50289_04150 [Betaproteobacteria bacterium]
MTDLFVELRKLFSDANPDAKPERKAAPEPGLKTASATAKLPGAEMLAALAKRTEETLRERIEPLLEFNKSLRLKVFRIETLKTPENSKLLSQFSDLDQGILCRTAKSCLEKADVRHLLDLENFAGWFFPTDNALTNLSEGGDPRESAETIRSSDGKEYAVIFRFYCKEVEVDEDAFATPAAKKSTPGKRARHPGEPALLELVLRRPNGEKLQDYEISDASELPFVIGRESTCELQVDANNLLLSRKHLQVYFEAAARRIAIRNISATGVAHNNSLLAAGKTERLSLTGGEIVLAPSAGDKAVHINYRLRLAISDDIETVLPFKQSGDSVETIIPLENGGGGGSAETAPLKNKRPPLAVLEVRYPDGKRLKEAIYDTPFEIGREPSGRQNFRVREDCENVSRRHLRLEQSGAGFLVENLAQGRSGTWQADVEKPGRFPLLPKPENEATDADWLVLAGQISVRLLQG